MPEIIRTDVLVVGGGLAGFSAAMRARDSVERVTLVDKATGSALSLSLLSDIK